MAIVFTKQKKKQSSLIAVVVLLAIITLVVAWFVFLKPDSFSVLPPTMPSSTAKSLNINFEALEEIKEFQPFAEIKIFETVIIPGGSGSYSEEIKEIKAGRENPFLP